ncbi:MAG: RNase adapter RapZ [Nocardioidaceae bacterium]|nr:RNase adapter RapZ [Nocardioidaceae bacterium]
MTGAGRSTAAKALEDLGWFVIDNLPPQLLGSTIELVGGEGDGDTRLAVVVDARSRWFFHELSGALDRVRATGLRAPILFLEASDEVLVRRQEAARRPHPLQAGQRLLDGIEQERAVMASLRGDADLLIDTTNTNVHQLAARIATAFGDPSTTGLRATVVSFGFKYGIPVDADMVADMRFLPNPFWVPELRHQTGLDPAVRDYVHGQAAAPVFLDRYEALLGALTGGFVAEGKRFVTLAIGCTGGKHRSVAMSEALGERLRVHGVETLVVHRDLGRE